MSHDSWPWMLTGCAFFRMPSRVPLSIAVFEGQPIGFDDQIGVLTEIVNADTEQADRTPAGFGALQQFYRSRPYVGGVACRRGGVAPCNCREIGVTNLDRHRSREERLALEPADRVPRHFANLFLDCAEIREIFG